MDLETLSRHELQQLCKDNNIKANLKTDALIQLLQTHVAAGGHLEQSGEGADPPSQRTSSTRSGTFAPNNTFTTVPDGENAPRTRKASRMTRAASQVSITPSVVPEVAAVESEKENKKDPPKRKAKETQKRLGVGKPRMAGGAGPRNVTRIVTGRTTRTRSREGEDAVVNGVVEMEAVIEEVEEEESNGSPARAKTANRKSISLPESSKALSRITAIEKQIADLFTTRDTLLSKLSSQEKDSISIKDDILRERTQLDDIKQSLLTIRTGLSTTPTTSSDPQFARLAALEARIAEIEGGLASNLEREKEARTDAEKALDVERERVSKLEALTQLLVERLDGLERRVEAVDIAAPSSDTSDAGNVTIGVDPNALFEQFTSANEEDAVVAAPVPAKVLGKRSAEKIDEAEPTSSPSKRPRRGHPEEAAPPPSAATLGDKPAFKTPPQIDQLGLPPQWGGSVALPGGSRGLRALPEVAPSPTLESPRRRKGKGKDTSALGSGHPSSSMVATPTTSIAHPTAATSTLARSPNFLDFVDTSHNSGVFPIYEPPSRYNSILGFAHDPSTSAPLPILPAYGYTPKKALGGLPPVTPPPMANQTTAWMEPDAPPPSPGKRTLYGTELDKFNGQYDVWQ